MFNQKETIIFFENLADQLEAGVDIVEAVGLLAKILPKKSDEISNLHHSLKRGDSFYNTLKKEGLLDSAIIEQINLGEQSGNLPDVLMGIARHENMMNKAMSSARKKLIPPAIILFLALMVGFFFVAYGLPKISGLVDHQARQQGIFGFSLWLNDLLNTTPWLLPVLGGGLLSFPFFVATNNELRKSLFNLSLSIPIYGTGVKHLMWGGWANYVSMSVKAGIPFLNAIELAKDTVPDDMSRAFSALAKDISRRSGDWDKVTNSELWEKDDPRNDWPLLLVAAFRVGGPSGKLDERLQAVVERLIEIGETSIEKATGIAISAAVVITGFTIMSMLLLVFTAQISAMQGQL